jgi:hypothetical protein
VSIDPVEVVAFLAPGFLALKIFYLFGAQRSRSEWEWTTWSVIASLPINGAAGLILSTLRSTATTPQAASASTQIDSSLVALALALAVGTGFVLAFGWRQVRASTTRPARWLQRQVTDSAWDQALEDAGHKKQAIIVVTDSGSRYRGKLRYAGREDAHAAGWLYLFYPDEWDAEAETWGRVPDIDGLLLDRARLQMVQVYEAPDDDEPGPGLARRLLGRIHT